MVEQECGPTRDPPQPASINMGLNVGNEVSLRHVADDTGDVPHRPNVPTTDVPREVSVAPELRQRIVVQIHGRDFALGHSSQKNWPWGYPNTYASPCPTADY